MTTLSLILNLKLSEDALSHLQREAGGLGVTNGVAAGAVLEHAFTKGAFMDPARLLLIVDMLQSLEPRPNLEKLAAGYREALADAEAVVQAQFEARNAGHMTLEFTPAMASFMREIERLFPELWAIFVAECVEAVLDGLEPYIDNAYSFPSPQDRIEAFRQVRQARDTYQQTSDGHRGLKRR